jgi:MFS transporter, DHA2 family, multidrug resistance protein
MSSPTAEQPGHPAPGRARGGRRWLVLAIMNLSLLLIVLNNSIVNVALPTLQAELDASTDQLQWIVNAYILVFAGLLLTMGALSDRFGRRGGLAAGLVVMGIAAVSAAFAHSASQLIAARAIMGVGGALVMPATLSIITNVFTNPTERARAIAIWAATAGAAVAIGPVVGGWLLEHFWWGSVFLINLPVVVVALLLGQLFVPTSRDPAAPRVDVPGAGLSIVGVTVLVYAIIEGQHGWTEPVVLAGFAVSAVLTVAFVLWERHTSHPMLDVRFFQNPRFSAASGALALTFFAMFGSMFLLTQLLQSVLGYSPLGAGIRMLPVAAVMVVVSPLTARVVEKLGTTQVMATGLLVGAAGLLAASRITAGASYWPEVVVPLVILAIGLATVMPPATESIMGSLPRAKAGVGSAVNDTVRQIGGTLGVAVLGSVFSSLYGPRLRDAAVGTPLPAGAIDAASDQIGAAVTVAERLGGAPGQALREAATSAFAHGMSIAFVLAAAALALGAVIVIKFLPARAVDALEAPELSPATQAGGEMAAARAGSDGLGPSAHTTAVDAWHAAPQGAPVTPEARAGGSDGSEGPDGNDASDGSQRTDGSAVVSPRQANAGQHDGAGDRADRARFEA